MPTVRNFEDLEIWKMSREVVKLIYSDLKLCRDYSYKNQITSAGVSIMSNIAEGFGRNSDGEFRNFLNFSKGSCCEVKSLYYVAEDQNYLIESICFERREKIQKLINSISRFMKYLKP